MWAFFLFDYYFFPLFLILSTGRCIASGSCAESALSFLEFFNAWWLIRRLSSQSSFPVYFTVGTLGGSQKLQFFAVAAPFVDNDNQYTTGWTSCGYTRGTAVARTFLSDNHQCMK